MLPLRSRWLRHSSASISRFRWTSIACASDRPPTPTPTPTPMPIPAPTPPTFGGMPPMGPEGGTRCPCLSPSTKTAGSLGWRSGYCRAGCACRGGRTPDRCKGRMGGLGGRRWCGANDRRSGASTRGWRRVDRREGGLTRQEEMRFSQGSCRDHQYPCMRALSVCSGIAHLTVRNSLALNMSLVPQMAIILPIVAPSSHVEIIHGVIDSEIHGL